MVQNKDSETQKILWEIEMQKEITDTANASGGQIFKSPKNTGGDY